MGVRDRGDILECNASGDSFLVALMTPRTYLILLLGILNSVLIIHLVVTPIVWTDTGEWYDLVPRGTVEAVDPALSVLLPSSTPLWCAPTGNWGMFEIWRPTPAQIAQLEQDLAPLLGSADSLPVYHPTWDHPPLRTYHRQYIGLHLLGEPPIIYVNAFIDQEWLASWDWRRRLVCVDDGGTGFWHVSYDPVGRRFRNFGFNGDA